ncbi:CAAX prenyl protease 1 [Actinomortierella ambigua]|nr:CAAX prenyl protease 1 [Actinomortierella ambigua]
MVQPLTASWLPKMSPPQLPTSVDKAASTAMEKKKSTGLALATVAVSHEQTKIKAVQTTAPIISKNDRTVKPKKDNSKLYHAVGTLFGNEVTDTFPYKEFVLSFSLAVYTWEQYLLSRHYRCLRSKNLPKALNKIVTEDEFLKAQAYGRDKATFAFVNATWDTLQNTLILWYNVLPWVWDLAGQVMFKAAGYGPEYEITQSLIFFAINSLASSVLSLPFSLYSTFVIEERHGFNKQTLSLFFSDLLKGYLIGGVIGMPFLAALLKIIKVSGPNFYVYVWVFMVAFQLIMISIYPTFIQPLFNKVEPLPDGELRTMIEALASRISFPLTKLFVIDGSKRSGHSNAYFYGFFKNKRIVLYDTLLEHSDNEEICAVLAHELGHWSHSHTLQMMAFAQLQLFTTFYLFSLFIHNADMYSSFGFNVMPTLIGLMLFMSLYSPVDSLMSFVNNMISRYYEFQADAFARQLGYSSSLVSGLIKLQKKNLGTMNPDWLYSMYHRSHPELVERLNAINAPSAGDAKTKKNE